MARCSKPTARWCASPRRRRRDERALILDHYDWSGGREGMLRFGPDADVGGGPVVVVALPLFEEANRLRAFAVAICRALAERGVANVLPDVPGQGESLVTTEAARLPDWRNAFAAAAAHAGSQTHVVAIRGGAAIACDAEVTSRWLLTPISGQQMLGELQRTPAEQAWARNKKAVVEQFGPDSPPNTYAGNRVSFALFADLLRDEELTSSPKPIRIVRLDTDPRPADRHVPGPPLWRRAEPDNDLPLAALLADDIADWIAVCED